MNTKAEVLETQKVGISLVIVWKCKRKDWLSLGLLFFSYLLCRFVCFPLHGMKDWPNLLAILGLAVWFVGILRKGKWFSMASWAGYLGGFVLGLLFQTEGTDPGGGQTSNLWILWTVFYLLILAAGAMKDFWTARKKKIG